MSQVRIDRRAVLGHAAQIGAVMALAGNMVNNLAATSALAQTPGDAVEPFTPDYVKKLAERLALGDYTKPTVELPAPFNSLSYDQYRDIRYRADKAIWYGEKLDFELQLFPMGWLYDAPVDMWMVEGGNAQKLRADGKLFQIGPLIPNGTDAAPYGFSGFRIHGPLNRSDYLDEYVVFQGASYLRAVGRGQGYGVSARGLAINTARPAGEEFPMFRAFWIEKPKPRASQLVLHALLDSPSTTGAYRFVIEAGETTRMDVEATLYPRKEMQHIGIAPLTSMFLHGPAFERVKGDFRPGVYDSEGLAILNGNGERLWRPLTNPRILQTSAFIDKDPKGFGLVQRDRSFESFEDLEARYEKRPTVWVEPLGPWGEGYVELIEIPVEVEIHDNIVAYWKPAAKLTRGTSYSYAYRLFWGVDVPVAWTAGVRVAKTRVGTFNKPGQLTFVIDYEGTDINELRELPVADVAANPGSVTNIVVQQNPEINGLRVSFEMDPGPAELVELRMSLTIGGKAISESWLYRWTKS